MKTKRLTAFLTITTVIVSFALTAAAVHSGGESTQVEMVEMDMESEESDLSSETLEPEKELITTEPPIVEAPFVEYPAAAQVWELMSDKGWSDEICAGIMGNMMAECGGNTLNLIPYAIGDSGTSFGLCQWHNGRKNTLLTNFGESIEAQINFLAYELGDVNTYFSNSNSVEDIAYEFCVKFERPSNKEQKGIERKALAQTAFKYFVGK